ncbi:MAG: T9SS type A sorting domain-containing protein [Flavobacteriales bacterium]|jgi:hypothetical protein|nr:T9SS type A sorting domain-containing protein [Flavobacteriales bacterium]
MKKLIANFLFFITLTSIYQSNADIIYVNKSASGNNNGTSWADAYTDFQKALSVLTISDSVWVAAGTYYPQTTSSGNNAPSDPRTKVFMLHTKQGQIFGGFSGTETEFSQRDIKANKTILSGNIGDLNSETDNVYTVLYIFNSEVVVDGFTIQEGYATETSSQSHDKKAGAGIYCRNLNNGQSVLIKNCTIKDNIARSDAGICGYIKGGTFNLFLINNRITNNLGRWAPSFAMMVEEGQLNTMMINCLIDNNKVDNINTEDGVGIPGGRFITLQANTSINAKVINSTFTENNILNTPSSSENISVLAIQEKGSSTNRVSFHNCIIHNNDIGTAPRSIGNHSATYKPDSVWVFNTLSEDSMDITSDYVQVSNPKFGNPLFSADYELLENSPAINAGDTTGIAQYLPSVDLKGETRILDDIIDLGCFEFKETFGVNEWEINTLELYPNPAKTHINIRNHEIEGGRIYIYNQLGKMVCNQPFTNKLINLNTLKSGLYFIRIKSKQGMFISKFVKE